MPAVQTPKSPLGGKALTFLSVEGVTVLHIALWSQLGVLTRVYIDKFFTDGCIGEWGVCLLSQGLTRHSFAAYFPDLASNMLGSFVMGSLIASTTFELDSAKAVAALPLGHPWQVVSVLYAIAEIILHNELRVLFLAIASDHPRSGFVHGVMEEAPELFIGMRTGFCGSLTTFSSWQLSLVLALIGGRSRQGGQWAEFLWGEIVGLQLSTSSYAFGGHVAGAVDRWLWQTVERRKASAIQADAGALDAVEDINEDEEAVRKDEKSRGIFRKTNVATAGLLCLLTALWIVLAVLDTGSQHLGRREQWFAILLGPFGATLRWKLVTLHGKLPGWRWFPLGTFVANILACCIDFGLQAGLQRASLGYWAQLMFAAIRVGFAGSLSTVSTFVAEVHKALMEWPDKVHAYLYALVTIGAGVLSGVIIYGWSVWA